MHRSRSRAFAAAAAVITSALVASSSSLSLAAATTDAAKIPTTNVVLFRMPAGGYDMQAGLGSMWIVRTDEFHDTLIYRVDPTTNAQHRVGHLKFAGGAHIAVGYGSLWITDYFGNAVWRVSAQGRVQAKIPTGLQPEAVHLAFGSVWVGNHHSHSVTRIDPRTDTVLATDSAGDPTQFRDGPQDITSDASRIYVGSSDLSVVQSIDPATNVTTTPAGATDDQFCGPLTVSGGSIWNSDRCTNTLYRISPVGVVQSRVTYGPPFASNGPQVLDETRFDGKLWVAVDESYNNDTSTGSQGVVEEREPHDGTLLGQVAVGGDVSRVRGGFGSLWTFEAGTSTVRRMTLPGTP
ncbi:MAG: hypothetical protein M3070_10055 [Actinomycetota bacterium]|nr:hypothetical protein [Actinomycetota bacterium]